MMLAGVALTMLGGIMDANSRAGQLKGEAATAKFNADVMSNRATETAAAGARQEEQARREYRQFAGEQGSAISENGFASSGSLLDLVSQSETRANLDALRIRTGSQRETAGLQAEAAGYRMRSSIAKSLVGPTRFAGYLGALGQGLSGVGRYQASQKPAGT